MRHYLFQLNEDTATQILESIESGGEMLSLPFRNHCAEAGAGDQVVLWVQGKDAFAFATGEIVGVETLELHHKSYREPKRGRAPRAAFPVRFDGYLERNVPRAQLKKVQAFAGFPFQQANVRNPFELSTAQYDAIFDLAQTERPDQPKAVNWPWPQAPAPHHAHAGAVTLRERLRDRPRRSVVDSRAACSALVDLDS